MIRRVARAAVLLALAACASAPGTGGGYGGASVAPGEERIVVGRFTDVFGLAASRRYVFVAGTTGIAIYDAQFDAWLPPRLTGSAFPRTRLAAMAADPVSEAVWIGGVGEVTYYQPSTELVTRALVTGVVQDIVFDRRDPGAGALVRTTGGWYRVSTLGGVAGIAGPPSGAELIASPELDDVYRRFPAVRDFARLITQDAQLRDWPVTSGTIAPDRSEVFLGTQGNGVYRVDPNFNRGRQLPYGLLADGAGALARAADGVWVAPSGLTGALRPRSGLTFARNDLREWRWVEDRWDGPTAGARAFDVEVRGSTAWIATDRGLARMNVSSRDPSTVVWSLLSGLPSDVVYAVAARDGGAWAGTERGLAFVSDTGRRLQNTADRVGETLAGGVAVRALLAAGDTLWVGTEAGLLLLPPGDGRRLVRTTLQEADARLGQGITALAASDSVVAVGLAGGDVVRINVRTGRLLPRLAANVATVGPVVALAQDARTLWVAGTRGVVVVDRLAGTSRFLAVPADLPSEVSDVVLADDWAWIGTRTGLVRIARLRDGMPR